MTDTTLLHKEMAGVAEFMPERPTPQELMAALIEAFQEHFGIEFQLRTTD